MSWIASELVCQGDGWGLRATMSPDGNEYIVRPLPSDLDYDLSAYGVAVEKFPDGALRELARRIRAKRDLIRFRVGALTDALADVREALGEPPE